jgi:hypothetical protein
MDVWGPGPCIEHIDLLHPQLAMRRFSDSDLRYLMTHFKM